MKAGRSINQLSYRDLTHAGFIPLGIDPFQIEFRRGFIHDTD
ncbi:hypothetical protein GJS26_00928 [Pectobacterium carotovorum subsp. carotovorum]|nr:hypothetical protein [Pectobacterium carotovorum subsp. carotovorum]